MKKISILFILFLIYSCNKDEVNESKNYHINKYFFDYMNYPQGMSQNLSLDNQVKLEYDSDFKILKRVGGYIALDSGSGFNAIFSNDLYDILSYSGNEIFIERKTSSPLFNIAKFERKLFLDNQNRIYKKTIFKEFSNTPNDTIYYKYDNEGKLIESKWSRYHLVETSTFYYNQNNNLDSIVALEKNYENPVSKTVEKFKDYDNSDNPLKNLVVFEETFYRSLSKNNFRKYERRTYLAYQNSLTGSYNKTWILKYDTNGNVNFENK